MCILIAISLAFEHDCVNTFSVCSINQSIITLMFFFVLSSWNAAGRHAHTPVACVAVALCAWLWNLFIWMMAELCMVLACAACVSCWVSGVLDVCLCRALWRMCAQLVLLLNWYFCPCVFEKVEHIIHRQGHMLSSRSPLFHPHNVHCHAHSCQLLPVFLPMPITEGLFTFRENQHHNPLS